MNTIFTDILKKYIFNKDKNFDESIKKKGIRNLASHLLNNSNNYYKYKAVSETLHTEKIFSQISKAYRNVVPDTSLYSELYNKLLNNIDIINVSQVRQFVCGCNSYSPRLKALVLVYAVPILDDS